MTQHETFSPGEILKTSFKVSKKADALNDKMMTRLGSRTRFMPARLAIAYAIYEDDMLPPASVGGGRVMKGLWLFGDEIDILSWTALIQTAFPEVNLSTAKNYESAVSALLESGLHKLDDLWNSVGESRSEFIKRLAGVAGINTSGVMSTSETVEAGEFSPQGKEAGISQGTKGVSLTIGKISEDVKTGEKVSWELNKDGNAPVLALMGSMGTGKTETAFQMIEQIKDQSNATFLVFDVKGDLSTVKRSRQTGATIIDCSDQSIPLDAFTPLDSADKNLKRAAQDFRDTFIQIPRGGMGPSQQKHCYEAAYRALKSKNTPITLSLIKSELDNYYEEESLKRDGLQNTMDDMCIFEHFVPEYSLDAFFSKSWILDIHDTSQSAQRLITFFVIDALWNWYAKQGDSQKSGSYRSLRNVLVVDEAREVLKRGQRSLINIVRQSRSKGGVTMFMSQSPDDFEVDKEDFLANLGLIVSFNTSAKPSSLKHVLGATVDLNALEPGHCFVRPTTESKKPMKVKVW